MDVPFIRVLRICALCKTCTRRKYLRCLGELLEQVAAKVLEHLREYSGLKRPGYRGSGTIVPQQ